MLKTTVAHSGRKRGRAAKEQRATERYGFGTTVFYTPSSTPSSSAERRRSTRSATAVNASNGGMCLQTKGSLLPRQIIRLEIPTSTGRTTSPTLAEICWVKKVAGVYQAGVRFVF